MRCSGRFELIFEALITAGLLLLLALFILALAREKSTPRYSSQKSSEIPDVIVEEPPQNGSECPLCGEWLPRGTRVRSELFPGKERSLMHIHGCPYCDPRPTQPSQNPRTCPSCQSPLGPTDYVLARVSKNQAGKTHVNVFGCTRCSPG